MVAGISAGRAKTRISLAPLVTVCLMMVGYCSIYVSTSASLDWHLNTSFDRLVLQLWPALIFSGFLLVRARQ